MILLASPRRSPAHLYKHDRRGHDPAADPPDHACRLLRPTTNSHHSAVDDRPFQHSTTSTRSPAGRSGRRHHADRAVHHRPNPVPPGATGLIFFMVFSATLINYFVGRERGDVNGDPSSISPRPAQLERGSGHGKPPSARSSAAQSSHQHVGDRAPPVMPVVVDTERARRAPALVPAQSTDTRQSCTDSARPVPTSTVLPQARVVVTTCTTAARPSR